MPSGDPSGLRSALGRCRSAGLRRTRALEGVLARLLTSPHPLTAAEVADSALLGDHCDKATVYRLLLRLEQHGVIRRLGLHDRSAHFALITPGRHDDYLICTECGAIEKLDLACPVEKLEARISRQSGFRKLYHELEFFGICPGCA